MLPNSRVKKPVLILTTLILLTAAGAAQSSISAQITDDDYSYTGYGGFQLGAENADSESITVRVSDSPDNNFSLDSDKVSFELFKTGSDTNHGAFTGFSSENWNVKSAKDSELVFEVSPNVSDTKFDEDWEFNLKVNYDGGTVSEKKELTDGANYPTIDVKKPWRFEVQAQFEGSRQINYDNLGDLRYKVTPYYLGQNSGSRIDDIYSRDVEVKVYDFDEEGEEFEVSPIDDIDGEEWDSIRYNDDGTYTLTIPQYSDELDVGKYLFEFVYVDEELNSEEFKITDVEVNNYMDFSGRVTDMNKRGVQSKIKLTSLVTSLTRSQDTGRQGRYSMDILPGDYDVTLSFSGNNKVFIQEANIENSTGAVNFDYWNDPSNIDVEGLKPVNMMGVQFGHPLSTASAQMKYDPSNINYQNVKVFECAQWNFFGKKCLGEWDKINENDVTVKPTEATAYFPVEPHKVEEQDGLPEHKVLMNAYVIGTNADLKLNNDINIQGTEGGKAPIGRELTVSGMIVSSADSSAIEDVDVEIRFVKDGVTEETFEGETDSKGRFSLSGDAPNDVGNYTLKLEARETPFNNLDKEFDEQIETFVKEGVAVEVPETVEIKEGEESTAQVAVENIGQRKVTNVGLSISGLNSEFVELSQDSWTEIGPGESRDVNVTIDIPTSYCDPSCGTYPTLDFTVTGTTSSGEESEDTEESQTTITKTVEETGGSSDSDSSSSNTDTEESETNDQNDSGTSFSPEEVERMTGEFLASQSSLNIALALIMIFTMVLAGAIKKKKNGGGRQQNGRERNGRPMISKPQVSGESDSQIQRPQVDESRVDEAIEDMGESIEDEEVDAKIDEIAGISEGEGEESEEEESENESFKCDVCGEEFDSESGRKLHKQALH